MGIIIDHSAHTLSLSRIPSHISMMSALNNCNCCLASGCPDEAAPEFYWGNVNTLSAFSSYKEQNIEAGRIRET